jgi:predicted RNase H-like HicB family nuclease
MALDSTTGRSEMKYPVIYEATPSGFSAYVPDLQGCVAAGESLAETRENGEAIPMPSVSEVVEVAV